MQLLPLPDDGILEPPALHPPYEQLLLIRHYLAFTIVSLVTVYDDEKEGSWVAGGIIMDIKYAEYAVRRPG